MITILKILKSKLPLIILLIIICLSIFLRLYRLNDTPPGLYPDIAINGNDALDTIKTGQLKLFYPENNGREGLFMWLISLSFLIFGASVWAIRIVSAVIGILTIFGIYLLGKELFTDHTEQQADSAERKTKAKETSWVDSITAVLTPANVIGLLSALLLAFSFWHINFSRMGFRVIMVPFILAYFGYFFFHGFRKNRILSLVISGIFFGLGFYTYIGFRMAVLILPFILIPYLLKSIKEKTINKFITYALWFLGAIFVTALPIGIYFLTHFGDFIGRASGVSIFSQLSPIKAFFISLFSHLLMFNARGDFNWRHNFSGLPMLPFSLGILFITGIVMSVVRFIRSVREKNYHKIAIYSFIFAGSFSSLLPGILTIEGIPHDLRVLGVVPFVYILSAIGGLYLFNLLYRNTSKKYLVILAGILLISSVCYSQKDLYFEKWGKNPEVINAFSNNYVELGNYLNSVEDGIKLYVIVNQDGVRVPYPNGLPVAAQTPIFIERVKFQEPRAMYLYYNGYDFTDPGPTGYPALNSLDKINPKDRAIIIPMGQNDPDLFVTLLRKFPEGHFWKAGSFMMFRLNFNIDPVLE
ncbi:MAG: glycosyltransferase family 39 protein [bacterium]